MKFMLNIKNYFFENQGDNKNNTGDNKDQNNVWKQNNNDKDKDNAPKNKKNNTFLLIMVVGVGVFMVSMFMNTMQGSNNTLIPYSQFIQFVQSGDIQSVTIVEEKEIEGIIISTNMPFKVQIPYFDSSLLNILRESGVSFAGTKKPVTIFQMLSNILPWLVSIIFILYMLRSIKGFGGGGGLPFTKNKIKSYVQNEKTKTTFGDVAGQEEAKYELKEVVEFLKSPEKFEVLGAKIPRGVLLVGSPGTGKTLLARACAGEAEVKFFYMSGSDFVEMFAGVGASRVRELFDQARKNTPCIIFIDELDAVGRSRSNGHGGGVHDEREQTLNQLLVEMDGFDNRDRIIVLAATNRPDVLDQALLRPGRFDRQVVVDMPDLNEREAILKIHAKVVKLSDEVDIKIIARGTVGCSGADLANIVNESALLAARGGKKSIEMVDFEEARDKILMGAARKSKVITQEDKLKTALHESGHAILHFLLKNSDPLHKVTIIPRGRALGVAFSLPEKDSYGKGKGYLLDRISICYGGFIAEQMYYDETSTGVQNDLEQATNLATRMVRDWGMSKLGAVSYSEKKTSLFLPIDSPSGASMSNETNSHIDKEIRNILDEAYSNAETLLSEYKVMLGVVADELMKHETLLGDQVEEIIGINKRKTTDVSTEEKTASSLLHPDMSANATSQQTSQQTSKPTSKTIKKTSNKKERKPSKKTGVPLRSS